MPKVLVVDDSSFSRKQLVKPLHEAGHTVVEAHNGQMGLSAVQEHQPDCVVTDLLMPEMDGLDFIKQLKSLGISVPVLVHSADIQVSTRQECQEAGCIGFLNKPCNKQELLDYVDRMTNSVKDLSK